MADHYFSLPGGLTARFTTACAMGDEQKRQMAAYVPGIAFMNEIPARPDIVIDHRIGNAGLTVSGHHITLTSPPSEALPADLYHLTYAVTRRALLDRGYFCVHAACVGAHDDFRLVVGHSGAGKTTLAHRLVDSNGLKLLSGNKTVVRFSDDGTMIAVAGTRTMTAVDKGMNRFAYNMAESAYAGGPRKIRTIDIVRINDGVAEVENLSPLSALHTLYPYFLDAANADVIVNGRDIFDGAATMAQKAALARGLSAAPLTRKISGTMDFMAREVMKP